MKATTKMKPSKVISLAYVGRQSVGSAQSESFGFFITTLGKCYTLYILCGVGVCGGGPFLSNLDSNKNTEIQSHADYQQE